MLYNLYRHSFHGLTPLTASRTAVNLRKSSNSDMISYITVRMGEFLCKCVPVGGYFQKVDKFHISHIL